MTASSLTQRRVVGDPLGHVLADALAQLPAASGEHLVEEVLPADRLDGREEPGRQAVVVRWEEVLRLGRHVVQVARTSDAVPDGLAADQPGRFERSELLEDAGPAGTDAGGELFRRAWAVHAETQQQIAAKVGRSPDGCRQRRDTGVRPGRQKRLGHCVRLAPATVGRCHRRRSDVAQV